MEFLVSYFPLETTACRDADLGPKQQVQWAEQLEELKLAECKYRIWKGNAEPKLAVPTVFTAAFWLLDAYYRVVSFLGLWTAYQNLQMAMNHKSLPCIPWEWKGEGAWSRLPAGSDHCGMLLGWAGRGMTSSCPWDVVDVITKACLAFFGTRSLTTQQPSCWEGSDICVKFFTGWDTNLSAKIKIIRCV